MSIAAISSSYVSAVRASVTAPPVEPVQPARAVQRGEHEGGRRHDLVDAMNQVLGIDGEQSKAQEQAVFRFAHALMHDLRSIDAGSAPGPGRGHSWGRRDWSDLPQRIDALATAAAAGSAAPVPPEAPALVPVVPVAPVATEAVPGASADTPPPVAVEASQIELPSQPNPVTTTSAALHLMQVPSSRLLEAFAALRRALGEQSDPVAAQDTRADLAATLDRLSDELAADSPAALPAGSVLNLTA